MEFKVVFPGGKRVDAQVGNFTIRTDQPPQAGGTDSAPSPFVLFLGSIATCAGYYAMGFCDQRGLSVEGIEITQRIEPDPITGLIAAIDLEIRVPPTFPEKYLDALVRAASQCTVKKHLEHPPEITVRTVTAAGA